MIPKEADVTLVFRPEKRGVLNAFRNGSKLDAQLLHGSEPLKQRQIEVAHVIIANVRERLAQGPEGERRRMAEHSGVEVAVQPLVSRAAQLHAGAMLFALVFTLKSPAVLFAVILKGVPVWNMVMPLNYQPPKNRFATRGALEVPSGAMPARRR